MTVPPGPGGGGSSGCPPPPCENTKIPNFDGNNNASYCPDTGGHLLRAKYDLGPIAAETTPAVAPTRALFPQGAGVTSSGGPQATIALKCRRLMGQRAVCRTPTEIGPDVASFKMAHTPRPMLGTSRACAPRPCASTGHTNSPRRSHPKATNVLLNPPPYERPPNRFRTARPCSLQNCFLNHQQPPHEPPFQPPARSGAPSLPLPSLGPGESGTCGLM